MPNYDEIVISSAKRLGADHGSTRSWSLRQGGMPFLWTRLWAILIFFWVITAYPPHSRAETVQFGTFQSETGQSETGQSETGQSETGQSEAVQAETVQVETIHSQDKYPAGGSYPILFKIRIPASWYIHGLEKRGIDYIPTALSFSNLSGVEIKGTQFPSPESVKFSYTDKAVEVFSGEILTRVVLKVSRKAPLGELAVNGQLSYQACTTNYCMPPEEFPIRLDLTIAPPGTQVTDLNKEVFKIEDSLFASQERKFQLSLGAGLWWTLLGIFLGGMALNLTPCIYPLIPITVSYFGGMSKEISGRTVAHGLLYISGLAITNSILGLTASLTGSMMGELLQEPIVLLLVSGVLFFLALSFFDVWEFHLPSMVTRMASANFGGYFGTFFMGLTLGIVAAPCLGPFMLGLLTYVAQLGDPFLGFLYFFVLSIGMGLPLAVLAIFSGTLKKLPMSGGWLNWIRKGLGWILVGMSVYIMTPLISEPIIRAAAFSAILIFAGLHLGWLDRETRLGSASFQTIKKGVGVLLICTSAVFFMFDYLGEKKEGVKWVPYEPALLEEAVQDNKPVILDFYAEWCVPCKAMEKTVFKDPEVVGLSRNFATIRVDLTRKHKYQDELERRYKIKGAPTFIFINKEGGVEKHLTIECYVDKDVILDRMKQLIGEL